MHPRIEYLNGGTRIYGEHPVVSYPRSHWEFQAVVRGRIAEVSNAGAGPWCGETLWVFEPGWEHGWTGIAGEAAEIVVFHLSPPDPLIQRLVRERGGMIRVSLGPEDLFWLQAQYEGLRGEWASPTEATRLRIAFLLAGLGLQVLRGLGYRPAPLEGDGSRRTRRALYWYRQNLLANPSVEEVAAGVGVSAVHLRRLFQTEVGHSPKQAFQKIRMEHARELLRNPATTVESVAQMLGFADASSFTRAYRAWHGESPGSVRRASAG